MSQRLIDHNADLKRLRDEGFTVEVQGSFLLVHNIPYVDGARQARWGTLVSTLNMSGETVLRPDTHVSHFIGDQPCHKDGRPISQIVHTAKRVALDRDLYVDRSFSNKPRDGYRDYHHKMSTYADIISAPAFSMAPENTPRQFIAIKSASEESVFVYHDTASSRAGISAISRKLEVPRVAIFGLGGTGSYILDLLAKTPIRRIDLYDGDRFYSHNAFRAPGAASLGELEEQLFKVEYFARKYSQMRTGVVPHPFFISANHEHEIEGISFAFVSMDSGETKRWLLEALEKQGIPFIDCGVGVEEVNGGLTGQVRTTTGLPSKTAHIWEKGAISFADPEVDADYTRNIQIADLNALNAVLAVIKFKKILGFYLDFEAEKHSIYPIDGNVLINAYSDDENDDAT